MLVVDRSVPFVLALVAIICSVPVLARHCDDCIIYGDRVPPPYGTK